MIDCADKTWLANVQDHPATLAERQADCLARLGTRSLAHPRSSFGYVPSERTDIRATFIIARQAARREG